MDGQIDDWIKSNRLLNVKGVKFGLICNFFMLVKASHSAQKYTNRSLYLQYNKKNIVFFFFIHEGFLKSDT